MTRTAVRYGAGRGQVTELWLPEGADAHEPLPVVVLIHGGFWRARLGKVVMRPLARSVVAHGWAAWNIEYRRTGVFGGGGGWPSTFTDVAAAVDALAEQPGLDLTRVVTCGHSAGGHLAFWLGARLRLVGQLQAAPVAVPVTAAISLAGVTDLRAAYELGLGKGATETLLGGSPETVPERYDWASPIEHLPLSISQVLVHGLDDTVVPPALSTTYARRAEEAGDESELVELPGGTHREMISAQGPRGRRRSSTWAVSSRADLHLGAIAAIRPSRPEPACRCSRYEADTRRSAVARVGCGELGALRSGHQQPAGC